MAQYVPYIPEVIPETPLYTPDMNFFDHMMQRKQSMFEQGLNKARTAYTSVLNAPLGNKNNIPLRDQYIKDAKENLKSLSSADLSLPQNVAAAENIFAPFWQDKFIMKDAEITKSYQNGFELLDAWKNSTDPKIREQYSGITEKYLMNGFEKLQNADRTDEGFAAIEKRKPVPFTNIQTWLSEQAKIEGMEVKFSDTDGYYLVDQTNGERSKQNYAVWAESRVGNNFYQQFEVQGSVEYEERFKILKNSNPNMSDDQIRTLMSNNVINELKGGYNKRTENVKQEISRIDAILSQLSTSNDPKNANYIDNLIKNRAELVGKQAKINEEYADFNQTSQENVRQTVLNNPKAYFGLVQRQRLIDNWATGKAAASQTKLTENSAVVAAENIAIRKAELELNTWKAQTEEFDRQWKRDHPDQTNGAGKGSGKGKGGNNDDEDVVPLGAIKQNGIIYGGLSGIDVTKNEATAYDLFNKKQQQDFVTGFNAIFDQRGILGVVKAPLGLDNTDIGHLATGMQEEIATDYEHVYTKEQLAASQKLNKALLASDVVKNAGITKIEGPYGQRQALLVYAKAYLGEKLKLAVEGKANVTTPPEETEAILRMAEGEQSLERYVENEKKKDELFKKFVNEKKEYSHLVVDRDGKKDIVSVSDLEKHFKNKVDFEDEQGNPVSLSGRDLATAYINGNVKSYVPKGFSSIAAAYNAQGGNLTLGYEVMVNGQKLKTVSTVSTNIIGQPIEQAPKGFKQFEAGLTDANKIYGSSEKIAKDIQTVYHNIVPNLQRFRNESGKQGTIWEMIPDAGKTMLEGDNATLAIVQALNTANADIYDENGTPVSTDLMSGIRSLLGKEKNIEDYISAQYIPQGINGQKTIRVRFSKPVDGNNDAVIGNTSLKAIAEGNVFNLVVSDSSKAPALNDLPNSTGYYVFEKIGRGHIYKTPDLMKSAGFEAEIVPNKLASGNQDASPDFVTLSMNFVSKSFEKDPTTGEYILKSNNIKDKSTILPLTGTQAKNPDEIISSIHAAFREVVIRNQEAEQAYTNYLKNRSAVPTGTRPPGMGGAATPAPYNAAEVLRKNNLGHLVTTKQ